MTPTTAEPLAPPTRVLMCSPDHFDVAYAINPHMTGADGALQRVDRAAARAQWEALRKTYEAIGYPVDVIPGEPGLPDMVFAANQTFPFKRSDGRSAVILSNMRHAERRAEQAHFERWFASRGVEIVRLDEAATGPFEGMGDVLRHPTRRRLYGGWGFRTSREALDAVAAICEAELVPLRLVDARFYHLDTCLTPIDDRRALVVREAFDAEGFAALQASFAELVPVAVDEAAAGFACNAHCPDGRNVIVDQACRATMKLLRDLDCRVRPVDTSEFRKAGGSVFCLKMMWG